MVWDFRVQLEERYKIPGTDIWIRHLQTTKWNMLEIYKGDKILAFARVDRGSIRIYEKYLKKEKKR